MAIEGEDQNLTVKTVERTWRTELFSEYQTVPSVRFHREKLLTLPDGTIISRDRDIPTVSRTIEQVGAQDFNGITGAQFAQKIAEVADILRQEDITLSQAAQEE